MSMNTPIGNITQTTPINSFHELTEMQLSQYLLGINNIAQGDGARITLQNLIKGIVSTDENNLITLDSNGRLSVTAGAFNTDTGWATAPTITIDWSAGTVMGVGGVFYLGGVLVPALSNFIADDMPTDIEKHYLYYNTQTQALEWSTGYPTVQSDFVHHICEIVILADGNKFAIQTWGLGGTSESVIEYLNATTGMVVLSGGQISNVVTDTPQQRYPVINRAKIGLANFSQILATTSTGSIYMQARATAENVLACEGGQAEIVPVNVAKNAPMYNNDYTLTALESGKFMNVWLVGLPTAGTTPYTTNYLYVTGDTQYDDLASAAAADPALDSSMLAIANQFERYCTIARFTLNYTGEDFSVIDYGRISQTAGGGSSSGGGSGTTGSGNEGIPTSACYNLRVERNSDGSNYSLNWQDPADTIIDNHILCTWAKTIIVRKAEAYPQSIEDGVVVAENTTKDAYNNTALVDSVPSTTVEYYYRAFPVSVNGVVNLDPRNLFGTTIYGYYIDTADSNPATRVHYVGHNENFKSAYMNYTLSRFEYGDWKNAFFMPRPVMLKYDGTVDYELNPDNYAQKKGGGASDITNTSYAGNVMVGFPQVWRYYETDGYKDYYWFANRQINDAWKCYTHINKDGDLIPEMFMSAYDASNVSNQLRSLSGRAPYNNSTMTNEILWASANGTYWTNGTLADYLLVRDLLVLIGKSTDTQTIFGNGHYTGGSQAGHLKSSGARNANGLFYGTTASATVKVFGIENFYGNLWKRIVGWIMVNGVQMIKLTRGTADGSTVDEYNMSGSGYISLGLTPSGTSGGYISAGSLVAPYGFFITQMNGSSSTYYTDGMWFNNGITAAALVGGSCGAGLLVGAFVADLSLAPSSARWDIGSSLSCKPPLQ